MTTRKKSPGSGAASTFDGHALGLVKIDPKHVPPTQLSCPIDDVNCLCGWMSLIDIDGREMSHRVRIRWIATADGLFSPDEPCWDGVRGGTFSHAAFYESKTGGRPNATCPVNLSTCKLKKGARVDIRGVSITLPRTPKLSGFGRFFDITMLIPDRL